MKGKWRRPKTINGSQGFQSIIQEVKKMENRQKLLEEIFEWAIQNEMKYRG